MEFLLARRYIVVAENCRASVKLHPCSIFWLYSVSFINSFYWNCVTNQIFCKFYSLTVCVNITDEICQWLKKILFATILEILLLQKQQLSVILVVSNLLSSTFMVDPQVTLNSMNNFLFFYRYIIAHTFKNIKTLSPGTNILGVPGKKQKEIPN